MTGKVVEFKKKETIFDRIGGRETVNAAVDVFYKKILADDRINHFFKNIDMPVQKAHQRAFLTYALGGTPNYSGKSLKNSHKDIIGP